MILEVMSGDGLGINQGPSEGTVMARRDFLLMTGSAVAGVASGTLGEQAVAQPIPNDPTTQFRGAPGSVGLLQPQQNQFRNLLDTSGLWLFQLDPQEEGERQGWFKVLPSPRPIPVPCSWNEIFDDALTYLGLAWYWHEVFVPSAWRDQRVFLRVGSANYAAKVWVNGIVVATHLGGHLPFVADVTRQLVWDRPNVIAITVENKQLPERVPPGPEPGGGGVAGVSRGFPATTYDFFPFAGLQRPVWLYSVPPKVHIDDVTVITTIEGTEGRVQIKVAASGDYAGKGTVRLGQIEAGLDFHAGLAETILVVPSARLWSPQDPHLYLLTIALNDGQRMTDSYTLKIGIRTVEVRGEQLLLNGEPVLLKGFGKHEDFAINGRGFNLPVWVRDYELLRWVGANSYRTSHYPYAEEAMLLADQLGVLVINEIPAVGLHFEGLNQEFINQRLVQARQQLRELITRDKNHPSTIMWSVGNEPMARPPLGTTEAPTKAVELGTRFFRELYQEAHQLDNTRPVTMVGVGGGPREWLGLFDVVCINRYYGWYFFQGQLDQAEKALASELDSLHKTFGKPIILTEFGADTIPGVHAQPPEMWSEEFQVEFLRRYLDVLAKLSYVAGVQVWAFADFKTGQGTMRATATNLKGVFTRDRRPKMAAHYLRLRWGRK